MIAGSGSERVVRSAAARERALACAALVRAGLAEAQAQSVVSMQVGHTDRAVMWLADAERGHDRQTRRSLIEADPGCRLPPCRRKRKGTA